MPTGYYDHSSRKKSICIRGHNTSSCGRNKFGQCNDCYLEDILGNRKDPELKNFCLHGHDKRIVGVNKRGGCKECCRIWKKNYREKLAEDYRQHSPEIKRHQKIYRDKNKEYFLDKALMQAHKLTREQYNEMLEQQNSTCPGCLRLQSEFKKKFAVDHDHVTGKIRKLLCYNCNILLGHARDSIEVLQNLINYLNEFRD